MRPDDSFVGLRVEPPVVLGQHDLPPDPLVPVGYERRDTVTSLTMLLGNVAVNLAVAGAVGSVGRIVYKHRIANIGKRRGSLAVAVVAWDFLYYWDHRWMHEVRLFWANHVTHHSSQRYNLSTALRQPWSGFLLSWVYLPMPLLGIPAAQVAKAGQLNLLYQYWIHTEAIDRLPRPIEAVFNTPSHHRVHHGADQQYLDRNYGGVLIVWDKLFGTFEPEIRRVTYGLTKNIDTYNPLRVGYHEFIDIGRDVARRHGPAQQAASRVRPPGLDAVTAARGAAGRLSVRRDLCGRRGCRPRRARRTADRSPTARRGGE